MLKFHFIGSWPPGSITCSWVPGTFHPTPPIQQAIDQTWDRLSARPGVDLFDGPMCRLEGYEVDDRQVRLRLSRTSYKPFVGTNMYNPQIAQELGPEALANPVGLSFGYVNGA